MSWRDKTGLQDQALSARSEIVLCAGSTLEIPDPRKQLVPAGWTENVAAPAILQATDWEWLDEVEARLRAVASYIESFQGDRLEFEKALRLVEARRGQLLGPDVRQGERTDLTPPRAGELDASDGTKHRWRRIARSIDRVWPEIRDATDPRDVTQAAVLRKVRAAEREEKADAGRKLIAAMPAGERCRLLVGDVTEVILDEPADVILTDPPYLAEHLDCFTGLARFAERNLKDGGSLLVMSGQTHLPDVLRRLTDSDLAYWWTFAYLTPGGQAVQVWPRRVNTFWKPVLWFVKDKAAGDRWAGDVTRSDVNDNDKRYHDWGQSESGIADLLERVSLPGDLVCDPFLGGGTTAVVAARLDRRFVGVDVDPDAVAVTASRLKDAA